MQLPANGEILHSSWDFLVRCHRVLGTSARKPPLSDLIGENASPEREGNARGFIHPELDDGEEAIGLVVREKGQASSGRQSFAEGDGSHHSDFVIERQFAINASLRVLTSFTRGRSGG